MATLVRRARPSRRHERIEIDGDLEFRPSEETSRFVAHARDVSFGGFCFVTDLCLSEGDRVSIYLPETASGLKAVVRHVRPRSRLYVVGVEFETPITPAQIDRLRRL
jgi:hypothetical protein